MPNLAVRIDRAGIEAERPEGLTAREAALAECVVLHGMNKATAIKEAGYASRAAGYTALRRARVLEYMQGLVREHLTESSIMAAHVMRALMQSARSDYVKLEAAKDVLDRAGFKPVEKHAHLHGGALTIKIDLG